MHRACCRCLFLEYQRVLTVCFGQIITVLFSNYIRQEHFHVAEFLPIRDCLKQDSRRSQEEMEFLKGCYVQPELSADRRVWPESLSSTEPEQVEIEVPSETIIEPAETLIEPAAT